MEGVRIRCMEVVVWFADVRGEVYAPCLRVGGEGELFEESQKGRGVRRGRGKYLFGEET